METLMSWMLFTCFFNEGLKIPEDQSSLQNPEKIFH